MWWHRLAESSWETSGLSSSRVCTPILFPKAVGSTSQGFGSWWGRQLCQTYSGSYYSEHWNSQKSCGHEEGVRKHKPLSSFMGCARLLFLCLTNSLAIWESWISLSSLKTGSRKEQQNNPQINGKRGKVWLRQEGDQVEIPDPRHRFSLEAFYHLFKSF